MGKEIDNIKDLDIFELGSLKGIVKDICEKYSNMLADYNSINRIGSDTIDLNKKRIYDQRTIYMKLHDAIEKIIEEKLLRIKYDNH